jgi:CHAP domain
MANVGLGACSTNSEGGTAFETSCDGNGGEPEYWCADFAQWVWQEAGANTDGLDAAASTFYLYGQTNGTLHTTPSVGDAVVFNYMDDYAEHVAIVVVVNADGSIETVSGDWGGTGSTEAAFASTSQVVLNVPAYPGMTGSVPDTMGMTLSAFVSPVLKAGTVSGPPQCIVSSSGQQGTCIDTSTCASTGGTSSPGYCPGPDSEECCTGT